MESDSHPISSITLSSLKSNVSLFTKEQNKEKEDRISSCFPALPSWTEAEMKKWMDQILLKLQQESLKGNTSTIVFVGSGSTKFHHDSEKMKKKCDCVPHHGLWRNRDQVREVDEIYYSGWVCEYELPECVPGMFLFFQDCLINIYTNKNFKLLSERNEAIKRLFDIEEEVRDKFMSFWISQCNIPIYRHGDENRKKGSGHSCYGFRFDWTSNVEAEVEPYETKRARENVLKYKGKYDRAVEQYESVTKKSKKSDY